MTIDLRLGRWQEALEGLETCDVICTDVPYSKRNVRGYRSGSEVRRGKTGVPEPAFVIPYEPWDMAKAIEFAEWATTLNPWWVVAFGDHVVWRWLDKAFTRRGWFVFAPVIWGKPNPPPRMAAEGPCCAAEHVLVATHCDPSDDPEHILVARPRRKLPPERRGSRRGWYWHQVDPAGGCIRGGYRLVGQKPLGLMMKVLADYTLPGDLVIDPFAGSGTTAIACHRLGRLCITSEMDPATYQMARARIDRELAQGDLFQGVNP